MEGHRLTIEDSIRDSGRSCSSRAMKKISLSVESLSKVFNRRVIFENVAFSLTERQSMAITGKNGSGKSTLAKILCGLLSPSKGSIVCSIDGMTIDPAKMYQHVGLVSPYITMYEEFSGIENLMVFSRIRGLQAMLDGRSREPFKNIWNLRSPQ